MMKKTVALVLLSVVVIAVAVYYWLGGFQTSLIEEVRQPVRVVWGTLYQGKYGDLELRKIFVNTRNQLAEGAVQGTLAVVNYDSLFDTQEVNQLIGVILKTPDSARLGETIDTLSAGTYIRVHIHGWSATWPTPAKIHQRVQDYAGQRELQLGEKVVEHYFGSDSMWVEYPVIQ